MMWLYARSIKNFQQESGKLPHQSVCKTLVRLADDRSIVRI
ncbi:hypothetical protein HMPREF0208_01181 [Citrobacter koseri]|nr:hypothetical protein HMPREF0208_01181 [Citrobacter koseri]